MNRILITSLIAIGTLLNVTVTKHTDMEPTLHSITANLMVRDVDKTVAFYSDILGFELQNSVPGEQGKLQWAMMGRDGAQIMFQEAQNLREEYELFGEREIGGTLVLFITMDNLHEYYDRIRKTADIVKEPYSTFYGMDEFVIRDIDGYILTFAEESE